MRLQQTLTTKRLEEIEELYLEAFPKIERKPFHLMRKKRDEGVMEFLTLEGDEGEFEGLALTVLCQDMVLLDYFAITAPARGHGLGSEALALLKEYYAGRRLILEIERTDVEADNIGQRRKRKAFYLRNGMKQMPFLVNVFGTEMEVLTHDCEVSFEEYYGIYQMFGKGLERKVMLIEE